MKSIDVSSEILERDDFDSLHDVVIDMYDLKYGEVTDNMIKDFWNKLPIVLKLEAIEWGCSDTLVKDKMVEWYESENIQLSKE